MDVRYILKLFNDSFMIMSADYGWHQGQFQSLRYEVYCKKFGYADPARYPYQREFDSYDRHAISRVLVHKATGSVAAGLRLVLPDSKRLDSSFPIQKYCKARALQSDFNALFEERKIAELSRFCISDQFLQRADDTPYGAPSVTVQASGPREGRVMPVIKLGMLQGLLEMAIQEKISHCTAMLEPLLVQIFHDMGIHFQVMGDPIDDVGVRLPCWIAIEDLLRGMKRERPILWQIVTQQGRLHEVFHERVLRRQYV